MKKCPFCAEEIQDEAIKCKHCGEFINKTTTMPISNTQPVLVEKTGEYQKLKIAGVITILIGMGGCSVGILSTSTPSAGWLIFGFLGMAIGFVVFILGRLKE